jgi:hypothetical protein
MKKKEEQATNISFFSNMSQKLSFGFQTENNKHILNQLHLWDFLF